MPRSRRVMPFLQRRDRTWYFRFRIPGALRLLARRSELRISLGTRELAVARQRVEGVLPDVYRLKQLARRMSVLEPAHVQRALDIAFSEIVEKLDAPSLSPYARPMAESFVLRERWFDVSLPEFEAFLRDYPRLLEARPPLNQKANYREWVDPSIGAWPGNAVGKSWKRGGCLGYQIRLDLVLKVSAQERRTCQWCD